MPAAPRRSLAPPVLPSVAPSCDRPPLVINIPMQRPIAHITQQPEPGQQLQQPQQLFHTVTPTVTFDTDDVFDQLLPDIHVQQQQQQDPTHLQLPKSNGLFFSTTPAASFQQYQHQHQHTYAQFPNSPLLTAALSPTFDDAMLDLTLFPSAGSTLPGTPTPGAALAATTAGGMMISSTDLMQFLASPMQTPAQAFRHWAVAGDGNTCTGAVFADDRSLTATATPMPAAHIPFAAFASPYLPTVIGGIADRRYASPMAAAQLLTPSVPVVLLSGVDYGENNSGFAVDAACDDIFNALVGRGANIDGVGDSGARLAAGGNGRGVLTDGYSDLFFPAANYEIGDSGEGKYGGGRDFDDGLEWPMAAAGSTRSESETMLGCVKVTQAGATKSTATDGGFRCRSCLRVFQRKQDLKRHEVTHTLARDFACPQCGAAFARNDALARHIRSGRCQK
ncbi:hypothetical protein HDU84_002595 [Entophlyctis sp. JEL0112]|nr:hypothetical protein HDU84_002595 [Entophlyctis sp. JEL0112]